MENQENGQLREGILRTTLKAVNIMNEYFEGKLPGSPLVKEASKMIGYGLKVEHMNQLRIQNDRSVALRLIKFLPKDIDRQEYIRLTQPQVAKLMPKPKRK